MADFDHIPEGSRWLTMADAAHHFRISERTLRRRIDAGQFQTHRDGGRVLVLVHNLADKESDTADKATAGADRGPALSELEALRAEAEKLRGELAAAKVEAEDWRATADRLSQEGAGLWDQLAEARAQGERWEAVAGERQRSIERLEEERRNGWAALAAALSKIPAIEAGPRLRRAGPRPGGAGGSFGRVNPTGAGVKGYLILHNMKD
jgi:hypothetical protein